MAANNYADQLIARYAQTQQKETLLTLLEYLRDIEVLTLEHYNDAGQKGLAMVRNRSGQNMLAVFTCEENIGGPLASAGTAVKSAFNGVVHGILQNAGRLPDFGGIVLNPGSTVNIGLNVGLLHLVDQAIMKTAQSGKFEPIVLPEGKVVTLANTDIDDMIRNFSAMPADEARAQMGRDIFRKMMERTIVSPGMKTPSGRPAPELARNSTDQSLWMIVYTNSKVKREENPDRMLFPMPFKGIVDQFLQKTDELSGILVFSGDTILRFPKNMIMQTIAEQRGLN